jgi:hypothetical protein
MVATHPVNRGALQQAEKQIMWAKNLMTPTACHPGKDHNKNDHAAITPCIAVIVSTISSDRLAKKVRTSYDGEPKG